MLNTDTINKIAAGEVIIRPVSVIKELIENSIDAGATRIRVNLEAGGKNMIMVSDNGVGISYNEVPLAFKRHATSKILKLEDLETIDSLGFRGEALASIAAVSKVTITTRNIDEEVGSVSLFENGNLINQRVSSFQGGTSIKIEDLFYNTPARKKHLGKDVKEEQLIRELLNKLVISYPEISFQLISRGKRILNTPGSGDLEKTIDLLYGQEVSNNLISLNYENKPMLLKGVIGNLKMIRNTREDQIFFINNRYIKNRRLSEAFEEAYSGYIMKHQHPFGIIFITLPGRMLDVNIHPAKTEIKILNESLICLLFKQGIREHLKDANLIVDIAKELEVNKSSVDFSSLDKEKFGIEEESFLPLFKKNSDKEIVEQKKPLVESCNLLINKNSLINNKSSNSKNSDNKEDINVTKARPDFLKMKIIGQLFNVYILLQGPGEIYLIDQHAAHEAFLSAELKRIFANDEKIPSQVLMTAISLKFRPKDMPDIEAFISLFKEIGYECEIFGDDSLLVRTVPVLLGEPLAIDYLKEFIYECEKNNFEKWDSNNPLSQKLKDQLIMCACKTAIKGGQHLHDSEIKGLLERLMKLSNPFTCPHGRPIILKLREYELMKLFKRVV